MRVLRTLNVNFLGLMRTLVKMGCMRKEKIFSHFFIEFLKGM